MASWKLVEAVVEDDSGNNGAGKQQQNAQGGRGNRRGGGNGGGRGFNKGGNGNRGNYNAPVDYASQLSSADRNYFSHLAMQQIEHVFNADNLCQDTYVRAYMDVEGYVPLTVLCTYPNVQCTGALYYDIVEKFASLPAESQLEFDATNDTLRLRKDWEKWLMPNQTGGKGVPKYPANPLEQQAEGEATDGFEQAVLNQNA